jgi:hypothetical protein
MGGGIGKSEESQGVKAGFRCSKLTFWRWFLPIGPSRNFRFDYLQKAD